MRVFNIFSDVGMRVAVYVNYVPKSRIMCQNQELCVKSIVFGVVEVVRT